MSQNLSKKVSNIFKFFAGSIVLIIGISLILHFWGDVVILFRGVIGCVLALVGLFILYLVRD